MNRIKEARIQKQMNQDDLAKLLNCSSVTISRYETGAREIDSETINRLCDILGCTSDYLIGRTVIPSSELIEDEAELLFAFRAADPNIQAGIQALLSPYIEEKTAGVS